MNHSTLKIIRCPPASCWRWRFPIVWRKIAATDRLCSPTGAAHPSSRHPRWRNRLTSLSRRLTGTAANGRILLAAPITQTEIEQQFADHIQTDDEVTFDKSAMALRARRRKKLHAITLSEQPLSIAASADTARVLADGLVAAGINRLPWSKPLKQWRDRVMFLRGASPDEWPDLSDNALAESRGEWLAPALFDKTSLASFSAGDLSDALMALLPWELRARLDREAPTHFEAPTGTSLPIDYEAEQGPDDCGQIAGTVRAHGASVDREGQNPAGAGTAVAGASAGAGDARSAGFSGAVPMPPCGSICADAIRAIPGRKIRPARRRPAASSRGERERL